MNINLNVSLANYQQTNTDKLPSHSKPKHTHNLEDASPVHSQIETNSQQKQKDIDTVHLDEITQVKHNLVYSLDKNNKLQLDITDDETGKILRHISFSGTLLDVYVK